MILRDPVHGLVEFRGRHERVISALLDTREVQRLRYVRQLGFTSLVFPGAEHSRFSHSLGAAFVMTRLIEHLQKAQNDIPAEVRLDPVGEADAVAAALLHDLGHGPFSHLWEELLPEAERHESWTRKILLDPASDVYRALQRLSSGMPQRVAAMIHGHHRLGYLARAVSGTLDVDRCDYLLRDSHMTGVSYGVFDLDWLIQALAYAELESSDLDRWVLAVEGRKGLPPIEGFFLARQFMYQQVYHHKATRAAEMLIRATFVRVAELVRDGASPEAIPAALLSGLRGEPIAVGDYLDLSDTDILYAFSKWERGRDPILSDLTRRLFARRLPKTVPLAEGSFTPELWQQALQRTQDLASRAGYRPDLYVRLDCPSDVPYREPSGGGTDGLWIKLRHQPLQRLGEASFLLGQVRNKRIERPRLIFPGEIRDPVQILLAELTAAVGR